MRKYFLSLLLVVAPLFSFAQTSGNGGSVPWIVLTDEYDTSPFNDTTLVDVYFDGSSYTAGYVTALQFKIAYDGTAFDSLYTIKSNLSSNYVMTYNEDTANNNVLISIVYTGSSTTTSIPDGSIVTLKFDNIPVKLLYSNEQNLTAFTFAGYTPQASNSNGTDISVSTFSHGGAVNIPHRKFSGYVFDYGTGKGIPNLEYQLFRGNSLVTTVLGGNPTKTTNSGYYEMVYYEHFYGAIDNTTTDFDFLFKTEQLDSDNALSTADAYKVLLWANNQIGLNAYQKLVADVNHSHTNTIADSYTLYSYSAGAYNNWLSFGAGGYRDVMIIKPEQIKYLNADSTTVVTGVGTGPLGISPQETNWSYDLNAYNGITDVVENFYVAIMGDVNLTSLGGSIPSQGKAAYPIETISDQIETSIIAKLPDQEVATGDEFSIQLQLNTGKVNVHSFNFDLEYDPEVLEFLDASTPYLPNAWMLYFNTDSTGIISYGGMDASPGRFPIRTDTLKSVLEFRFKALKVTGVGETPVEFGKKNNTGDGNGDDLPTKVVNGKVYLHVVSSIIDPSELPYGFELEQNYPNPFNPSTQIGFSVINPQVVSLDIFTIDGRFVATVYEKFVNTGRHIINFDATNIPSGIYLYRLKTQYGVQTKKMTIIK